MALLEAGFRSAADGVAPAQRAIVSNKEVFDFLESAARKYGIEFWGPGSGIIHQIVLESALQPSLPRVRS